MISKTLQSVRPSATIGMSQKARELAKAGLDVISLAAGEPDFDTPEHIREAACRAITEGKTRYTAVDGIAELKEAISQKFRHDNGLNYTREEINVSPGGKAVLFNALMATLDPGDEVIVPAPCWVSYPEMVKLCGGTPVVVDCTGNGFKLSAKSLQGAITVRTKWLILNSPGNPTGACYSPQELKVLGEVLREHPHVMVITDDIYEKLIYDDREFETLASACPDLFERILTMNGVSKAYAMTGWRIGYAGGPGWLIDAMRKVMSQSTSNASSISQWAAYTALTGPQDFIRDWRNIFQKRRNFVFDQLNAISGISCQNPHGAFYVFANCQDMLGKTSPAGKFMNSDLEFCNAVLEEIHIALVPGSAFQAPGHFRLSFATDVDSLETALGRLSAFCVSCE